MPPHFRQCGKPTRNCLQRATFFISVVWKSTFRSATWLAKGYGSFVSAWRTLQGIEAVNMIRKGTARWVAKEDAIAQATFIAELFGIAA